MKAVLGELRVIEGHRKASLPGPLPKDRDLLVLFIF
jgi:hypothetical protein